MSKTSRSKKKRTDMEQRTDIAEGFSSAGLNQGNSVSKKNPENSNRNKVE
ncbi:MAG: hypothetical protein ACYCX2_03115 [Christensenellales bacterium]